MGRGGWATDVFRLLAAKYAGTAYVVLPQVPNATGFEAGRWCDAVVASLWPSRGLWLHGYEIKVSRHDWLRELKQGEKAETHYQYLDFFSVLVSGDDIVQPGELPETWGLAIADIVKGRIKVVKEAPRRSESGAPFNRGFVLGLLRAFDKECVAGDVEQHLKAEFERGKQVAKDHADAMRERTSTVAEKNSEFLRAFNEAHGLYDFSLTPETAQRLGHLVKNLYATTGFSDLAARLEAAFATVKELDSLIPKDEKLRRPRRAS